MRRPKPQRKPHGQLRWLLLSLLSGANLVMAAGAPAWMHEQANAPMPPHDERANAVILLQETTLTLQPNGKIVKLDRQVVRILRPDGESRGTIPFYFTPTSPILDLHAWSIPSTGKDYEVTAKEAIESAVIDVDGGELISDLRVKTLRIPAATVGSVIGYEVAYEEATNILADDWDFQDTVPVREARYILRLPSGWSYHSTWLNHVDVAPSGGPTQWNWSLRSLDPVRIEYEMPPWRGIAGRMAVTLIPPGGDASRLTSWNEIGAWYSSLTAGRTVASSAIKQKVAELTVSAPTTLAKIQALANFVQNDIRYVAIELGIGGYQPHFAADVFSHRYGDCKDKAGLLHSMLKEIGVESYFVIINTERGSVSAATPANLYFNHAILAIALPAELENSDSLKARIAHPNLGQILFFDPTDPMTPLGLLRGALQANFGMLVTKNGGELIELPQLSVDTSGVARTAKMTLDQNGTLLGEVEEVHVGDQAAAQREILRSQTVDTDRIKAVEALASSSLSKFQILKASVRNAQAVNLPFEWHYTLESEEYAKPAGELLLVRPRIIGSKSRRFLEAKEPRRHPIEFDGPRRDTDAFEIALPPGFTVDELPSAVDIDDGFISYHSKTIFTGGALHYTRSFEIKELSVPVGKADQLKALYRNIENDERSSAVLKRLAQ
jgi:transglutaminase-like putative cysteine protease